MLGKKEQTDASTIAGHAHLTTWHICDSGYNTRTGISFMRSITTAAVYKQCV